MPTYEFRCGRCDKAFTATMHVDEHDRAPPECPVCHRKDKVEKRLSTFTPVTSHKSA